MELLLLLAVALLKHPDESGLLMRLRSRDPAAASELYDRYSKSVFSLILRIVRNHEAAEDLLQETYLRIWNRAHFLDPDRGSVGAWLLTVARNLAIDYLRSSGGRLWRSETSIEALEEPFFFVDFGDDLMEIERAQRVRAALEKLSGNQRDVIELAYFEGLSQSEMAERLGQPLGTIKTWVRSALRTLREELGRVAAA
ncbi:MAG: sigma-70 family RNA polymerase sigma factor [Bryobacteraceae bacterium]